MNVYTRTGVLDHPYNVYNIYLPNLPPPSPHPSHSYMQSSIGAEIFHTLENSEYFFSNVQYQLA